MNDFMIFSINSLSNCCFDHYLLIESYNISILNTILLIFSEIMYVFLKKQIFYSKNVPKIERIMKIAKITDYLILILHYFQYKK